LDKSILKTSLNLLGKYLICLTMAFIISASLFMVFTATSQSGDTVVGLPRIIMLIIMQICSLGTVILFMNGKVYYIADSDANKVRFGRIAEDKYKGLKFSLFPTVLALISYVVLILGKLGIVKNGYTIFNLLNYHLFGYHEFIFGGVKNAAEIGWGGIIAASLTVFLIPVICHISYTLGFKRINVAERLVFKKKETK
jgi:hypothetical protein